MLSVVIPAHNEVGSIAPTLRSLHGTLVKEGIAHELVVVKCPRQLTTLATWEYVKNQCPNYPRCLDFQTPCDGAGAPTDRDKFFSGKGMFRRLNWVWFGMVGGFIGWSLFALFKHFGLGCLAQQNSEGRHAQFELRRHSAHGHHFEHYWCRCFHR